MNFKYISNVLLVIILFISGQAPLLADIEDRIEYKVGRVLQKVDLVLNSIDTTETHDYVIVGAGTAGLTLAYLLKRAQEDVVVIEAGRDVDNDPNILNAMPLNVLEEQFRNNYFWVGDAKPLEPSESTSTNVHANHYDGGRVLGGTSSTNDTIWWRNQQHTYDQAGGIFTDATYISNLFKAIETYTGTSQNPSARGTNGPLSITQGPTLGGVLQVNPVAVKFCNATKNAYQNNYAINIPQVDDYNVVNGSFVSNFGQYSIFPSTLQRCSASIGLLANPIGNSIDIRLDSQLLSINFSGNIAESITYLKEGKTHTIKGRKKIILCTGHNTPAILLGSGIGDASVLQAKGIKVVYDNPAVGKNLKNHVWVPVLLTINPADFAVASSYPVAFKRISGATALPEPGNPNSAGRDYQAGILNVAPNVGALIMVFVNPQSTGFVDIVNKDPLTPAVTTLNYVSTPDDLNSMRQAVIIAGQIIQELNAIDPTYNRISNISNPSAYLTANLSAFHHWHGQTLIGEVVDEELNVIGTENLMVADLTIFPLTDGNTQSMAYSAGCAAYSLLTGDFDIDFN